MTFHGQFRNGVVIFDNAPPLRDGTTVRVEEIDTVEQTSDAVPRQGGQYADRIWVAPDFEQWPDDLQEALGIKP